MTLNNTIYCRKACRSFTGRPMVGEMIEKILSFERKPRYPGMKVRMNTVSRDKCKFLCPWTAPQLYVANEDTFRIFSSDHAPELAGDGYPGSVIL